MNNNAYIASIIRKNRDRLSVKVIDEMFAMRQPLADKYRNFYERLVSDVVFHYDYFAESVQYSSTLLLQEYARWLIVFFRELNVPLKDIELTFRIMQSELSTYLSEELVPVAAEHFNTIYSSLEEEEAYFIPSFITEDNPYSDLAAKYFAHLRNYQRREAARLLTDALEQGISIKDIYLFVFQRSQWEIGRLWQTGKISVAEEHIFTASTQLIISQLYPYLFGNTKPKGKIVAACVGRELHEIGIRMVADFFEMDGWDTIYIGANTPTNTLIQTVVEQRPSILALSTTIMPHLKNMREIIEKIRADKSLNYVKIIVGGYPFIKERNLWKEIKADGFAIDATQAIDTVNRMIN